MKKLVLATLAALASTAALAADFPADKPVTFVVPFTAGGPTDKVARDLAEAMRKPLGATISVENVGGAGGTLGAGKVAKAAPDGHTLLRSIRQHEGGRRRIYALALTGLASLQDRDAAIAEQPDGRSNAGLDEP